MTRLPLLLILATILVASGCSRPSPAVKAEGKEVKVNYGQPRKRGREIFGKLVPYGQWWRTGANEATVIEFKEDATFGNKAVKAGKYSLYTIPNADAWEVILNTETGQWGTEYHEGRDLLRVSAPAITLPDTVSLFTISFEPIEGGDNMKLAWDKTSVTVPILYGATPTTEPTPADSTAGSSASDTSKPAEKHGAASALEATKQAPK